MMSGTCQLQNSARWTFDLRIVSSIRLQLKLSLLKSQDEKVTQDLADHKKQNAELLKENAELEKFNAKEEEEIALVIQRI